MDAGHEHVKHVLSPVSPPQDSYDGNVDEDDGLDSFGDLNGDSMPDYFSGEQGGVNDSGFVHLGGDADLRNDTMNQGPSQLIIDAIIDDDPESCLNGADGVNSGGSQPCVIPVKTGASCSADVHSFDKLDDDAAPSAATDGFGAMSNIEISGADAHQSYATGSSANVSDLAADKESPAEDISKEFVNSTS